MPCPKKAHSKKRSRSKSSARWLQRHAKDPYVKEATKRGYSSRAAFKLLEIQEKYTILTPKQNIVELGSAPGGWTQVISDIVGENGKIVAVDLLSMDALPHVHFIQADFTLASTCDNIMQQLDNQAVDVVLSDMAPNMSGQRSVDQPKAIHLAELVIDFAKRVLRKNGTLLLKVFQGEGCEQMRQDIKAQFNKATDCTPKASRPRSRETYLLATGFKQTTS